MTRIELTRDDALILHEILEHRLENLRMEISHTDQLDYRTALKRTKATLEHVLSQLGHAKQASA